MLPIPAHRKRRSYRRCERASVLVRLSGDLVERLTREAEQRHGSHSRAALLLVTDRLEQGAA